jgi:hypothetical protein
MNLRQDRLQDFADRFRSAQGVQGKEGLIGDLPQHHGQPAMSSRIAQLLWGTGAAQPVSSEAVALALASGERVPQLRRVCQPSVSVVASRYAVASSWATHQGEGDFRAVDPFIGEPAMVLRSDPEVLVLCLPPGAASFMQAIQHDHDLGTAAGLATDLAASFDLAAVLALLFHHQALTSIQLPRSLTS